MAWRHSSTCPRQAQPSLLLLSSRQPSLTLTSQNAWPSCVASEQEEGSSSSELDCAPFCSLVADTSGRLQKDCSLSVQLAVRRMTVSWAHADDDETERQCINCSPEGFRICVGKAVNRPYLTFLQNTHKSLYTHI